MYLDPHDGKEPMFKAAVRLLHKHGESLDPLQVLEVPIKILPSYKKSKHNCTFMEQAQTYKLAISIKSIALSYTKIIFYHIS